MLKIFILITVIKNLLNHNIHIFLKLFTFEMVVGTRSIFFNGIFGTKFGFTEFFLLIFVLNFFSHFVQCARDKSLNPKLTDSQPFIIWKIVFSEKKLRSNLDLYFYFVNQNSFKDNLPKKKEIKFFKWNVFQCSLSNEKNKWELGSWLSKIFCVTIKFEYTK